MFTHQRLLAVIAAMLVAAFVASRPLAAAYDRPSAAIKDPWSDSDTLAPPELAKMLADGEPAIAYVGPRVLYRAGRIPGATFHGPTSEPEGLDDLKRWASARSRSETLVIYCGCCPMEKCPNIRPAFSALREMGLTKLRVLILPTSFEKDWVEKGFSVER